MIKDDLEKLYADLNPHLLMILRRNLSAPESLLEDACQIAWSSFIARSDEVAAGAELGWLSTTATRIALRQLRSHGKEVPWGEPDDNEHDAVQQADLSPGPHEVIELRERLADLHRLPARQAQMLFMRGLGYGYTEISELTGSSERTVERLLYKASRRLAREANG